MEHDSDLWQASCSRCNCQPLKCSNQLVIIPLNEAMKAHLGTKGNCIFLCGPCLLKLRERQREILASN